MNGFEKEYGKCSMYYTLSILEGKWKWIILWEIFKAEVIRYNQLKDQLQPIAHKTLSHQLKELESSKLIHREQYNQVPPQGGVLADGKGENSHTHIGTHVSMGRTEPGV